ncbi:MAG: antibiotic biosynthesis monooxygenase [Deltaproteobacteria bacterium]|nr:antibiotic biosynthesis monooxygenase [Candidatus Anaeroferrophillus wilburensis]MBN2888385.1 antibiotic biosynthesis monooxygenase [Deltaproteobacteria bacterium]
MIDVIASIQIKEGRLSEFLKIFKANVPKVLQEKGCLAYAPTIDLPTGLPVQEMNKNIVTIIEKWESLEALQTHLTAPHMIAYKEAVRNIVDKTSIKVLKEV